MSDRKWLFKKIDSLNIAQKKKEPSSLIDDLSAPCLDFPEVSTLEALDLVPSFNLSLCVLIH